jgi:DNA-binding SARP family transcriptional activator
LDFHLLAPVSVREDGVEINIGGPRPRAVLSLLLLNGNRRLSAERIVDALWDEPPKSARNSVQRFIADLRSSNDELAGRVHSDRGGYTFNVAPGELDLDRFAAAVSKADEYRTAGRPTE